MKTMKTIENPQRSVSSAYDSVNLINKILLEEKTEKLSNTIERNYKHLEVMLTKDWFEAELTPEQKTEILSVIEAAKNY
jgi:hypothetical protein